MTDPSDEIQDGRDSTASGKYAIIVIGTLAIGGALFNWWYQRELHRRALDFWGPETSRLIVQAPQVEAWRLAPESSPEAAARQPDAAGEAPARIAVGERAWVVIDRQEISTPTQAPGSSHVRRSLVNDQGFDWSDTADPCQTDWQYALRFEDGPRTETVLIGLDCPRLYVVGTHQQQSIRPMVPALREFFDELFPR
ncbi:MAG: hypothetical protein JNG90_13355 [Planctomycetaceae bacterium]|nr:hypothetical protein [Planctomycetaceae bacterium]